MPLAAEDHLAILDLIARQSHAIDLGNPEMWADCFTEGGVGSRIALGCNSLGGVQTCPP